MKSFFVWVSPVLLMLCVAAATHHYGPLDQAVNVAQIGGGSAPSGGAYLYDTAGTNKAGVNAQNQLIVNTEGQKATYSASVASLTMAGSATDVFTIIGSGTKTIRVTRVQISGTATAAAGYAPQLLVRSAADTVGTSTSPTVVPLDSNSAAGTAVCKAYTANPTLGAAVGSIRVQLGTLTTSAGAIPSVPVIYDFTTRNGQAVVLRGTAQQLAVNMGGVSITGASLYIDIEWTEE